MRLRRKTATPRGDAALWCEWLLAEQLPTADIDISADEMACSI